MGEIREQREATVTEEDDESDPEPEDRAERLVEIEERVRERIEEQNDTAETSVEFEPTKRVGQLRKRLTADRTTEFRDAPVVDAEYDESESRYSTDSITFTCESELDERVEYTLDVPASASDHDNPLVRICRSRDTPVDRLADLGSLPVAEDTDGEWRLVVPPAQRQRDITVSIDDRTVVSRPNHTPTTDRLRIANHRLTASLVKHLPLYDLHSHDDGDASFDARSEEAAGLHFTLPFAITAVAGLLTFNAIVAVLIGLLGGFAITFLSSIPFLIDESESEFVRPDD